MSTLHVVAVSAKEKQTKKKRELWMAKLQRRPLRTFIPRSRRVKVKVKVNANCLNGSWFQQILLMCQCKIRQLAKVSHFTARLILYGNAERDEHTTSPLAGSLKLRPRRGKYS